MIYTLIEIAVFILFTGGMYLKYGMITSISNSWYKMEGERFQYLFQLFLLIILMVNIFHEERIEGPPYFIFSSAGLALVACTPMYRHKSQERVHGFGAMLAIVLGYVAVWDKFETITLFWTLPFLLVSIFISSTKPKYFIWKSEVIAFAGIEVGKLVGYYILSL